MPDLLKFVDSISATPTVRLDLNDGTTFLNRADGLDFSPPPLRRAINGTLLTDGSVQSASSYDNRVLRMTVEARAASIDAAMTQVQLLNRELDRDTNYLMWQPVGASSPVFFRTLRSPATAARMISPLGTVTQFAIEALAEPFALGLREDILTGTVVNNDPAAGSNGQFFDITGVKGDVAAPAVIEATTPGVSWATVLLAMRQHGTPSNFVHAYQAESTTGVGSDTTNPGGGPDAAMSGSGTNNFMRCTFATFSGLSIRLRFELSGLGLTSAQLHEMRGAYRVFATVRRSAATSVITLRADSTFSSATFAAGTEVTVPTTTSRQIVDLGVLYLNTDVPPAVGYGLPAPVATVSPFLPLGFGLLASRTGGSDTLDFDCVLLAPADESVLLFGWKTQVSAFSWIVDGVNEAVYSPDTNASPFAGTVGFTSLTAAPAEAMAVSGGFPQLKPNQTNRLIYTVIGQNNSSVKTVSTTLNVSYWPRYLYARPATT